MGLFFKDKRGSEVINGEPKPGIIISKVAHEGPCCKPCLDSHDQLVNNLGYEVCCHLELRERAKRAVEAFE